MYVLTYTYTYMNQNRFSLAIYDNFQNELKRHFENECDYDNVIGNAHFKRFALRKQF